MRSTFYRLSYFVLRLFQLSSLCRNLRNSRAPFLCSSSSLFLKEVALTMLSFLFSNELSSLPPLLLLLNALLVAFDRLDLEQLLFALDLVQGVLAFHAHCVGLVNALLSGIPDGFLCLLFAFLSLG